MEQNTKYAPSLIFPSKILNYLRRELFCVFQFRITSNFLFDAAEISKYTILTAFFDKLPDLSNKSKYCGKRLFLFACIHVNLLLSFICRAGRGKCESYFAASEIHLIYFNA